MVDAVKRSRTHELGVVMYVIYDRPLDYPDHVVVRRWTVGTTPLPGVGVKLHESIEAARGSLPHGLTCLGREPHDDPFIVESWV